jgi:hypothetical protein
MSAKEEDRHSDRSPGAIAGDVPILRRQPSRQADPAFSDWVGRRLHETFDPIASEPLPPDLAVLIRELEKVIVKNPRS